MRRRVLPVLLLAVAALVPEAASAADRDGPLFRFTDDRITESSGLVDLGSTMVTTNDSGDGARLFVVDPRSGDTVGVTTYGRDAVDVEALAPAGPHSVWVADTGDNRFARDDVTLHRVPVRAGDRTATGVRSYRFTYPQGPLDVESLVVAPGGRIYVISKVPLGGGTVFRAPRRLSATGVNVFAPVGTVEEYATDAALTRDGTRLLVRSYTGVGVYTFPGLRRLGSFRLPHQPQGEALSVGPGDRVRVSSEGVRTPVLQVAVPPALLRPTPTPSAAGAPGRTDGASTSSTRASLLGYAVPAWLPWAAGGVIIAGVAAVGLRLRRRKG